MTKEESYVILHFRDCRTFKTGGQTAADRPSAGAEGPDMKEYKR